MCTCRAFSALLTLSSTTPGSLLLPTGSGGEESHPPLPHEHLGILQGMALGSGQNPPQHAGAQGLIPCLPDSSPPQHGYHYSYCTRGFGAQRADFVSPAVTLIPVHMSPVPETSCRVLAVRQVHDCSSARRCCRECCACCVRCLS